MRSKRSKVEWVVQAAFVNSASGAVSYGRYGRHNSLEQAVRQCRCLALESDAVTAVAVLEVTPPVNVGAIVFSTTKGEAAELHMSPWEWHAYVKSVAAAEQARP
jgi:hypothetical protein